MKKWMLGMVSAIALAVVITSIVFQHRLSARLRAENQALREQIERLAAANNPLPKPGESPPPSAEHFRELLKLRSEVTLLRRQQDDLLKQLAARKTPAPAPRGDADESWVQKVLNSVPKEQGAAEATCAENCCVAR